MPVLAEVDWQAFRAINEIGHPIIVVCYITLAFLVLFLKLPGRRETVIAVSGGFAFFWGCALHHIDMWVHGIDGTTLAFGSFHHTFATVLQVVGAVAFIFAAGPYAREWQALARDPKLLSRLRDYRYQDRSSGP